jgi:hypothetical protein
MGKLDEMVDGFETYMKEKLGTKTVDKKLLHAIAKGLGPSLYKVDAQKVACGQSSELETIVNGFCAKKLGITDKDKAMKGVKEVCDEMGSANRNKQRVVFYYLLVKKFKKSSVYA